MSKQTILFCAALGSAVVQPLVAHAGDCGVNNDPAGLIAQCQAAGYSSWVNPPNNNEIGDYSVAGAAVVTQPFKPILKVAFEIGPINMCPGPPNSLSTDTGSGAFDKKDAVSTNYGVELSVTAKASVNTAIIGSVGIEATAGFKAGQEFTSTVGQTITLTSTLTTPGCFKLSKKTEVWGRHDAIVKVPLSAVKTYKIKCTGYFSSLTIWGAFCENVTAESVGNASQGCQQYQLTSNQTDHGCPSPPSAACAPKTCKTGTTPQLRFDANGFAAQICVDEPFPTEPVPGEPTVDQTSSF